MTMNSQDSPILEQLIALRDHYQVLVEQHEHKVIHARQQLTHINALLVDQFLPASGSSALSIAALQQEPSFLPAISGTTSALSSVSAPTAPTGIAADDADDEDDEDESDFKATVADQSSPDLKRFGPQTKLPLLKPYAHLSKIGAVKQVLQENQGNVLQADSIIKTLYGDLSVEDLRDERIRIRATLNLGVRQGLWTRLKGRGGRYTLEPQKAQSATAKAKAKAEKPTRGRGRGIRAASAPVEKPAGKRGAKSATSTAKSPAKVAAKSAAKASPTGRRLRGGSLMERVINVMREHPGEVMTSESVAQEIFGALQGGERAKARRRISDIFSKGVPLKHWRRVQNQKGAYIVQS
jgi:hypothetical protein